MKIDWDKVWNAYDSWSTDHFVTWDGMTRKIQSLVEKQLKPKKKNISAWRQCNRKKK